MKLAVLGPILVLVSFLLSPFFYHMQGQLAPAPTLLTPVDEQQFEQVEVIEFHWEWSRQLGPDEKFQLTISGDDQSSANILSYLTRDPTWTLDPSIAPPGRYKWTVVVVYAPDSQRQIAHSQPSEPRHFQIRGSPAPELLEPTESQTMDVDTPIVLRWQWYRGLNPGEQFKVDLWRNDSSATSITSTLTSKTQYTITLSSEAASGEYNWTVAVVYAPYGQSEMSHSETSEVRHLRVGLLPAPTLLKPADGEKFAREPEITLHWGWGRSLRPSERFQVTIESSDDPTVSPVSQLITETTYILGLPQRSLPGTYTWSVVVVYVPDGQPKAAVSQISKIGYFEDEPIAAPTLLEPPNDQTFARESEITLSWQWVRDLGPDEQFRVTVRNKEDPTSGPIIRFSHVPTLTLSLADRTAGGRYEWQVAVVYALREQPEITISQPSEARYFVDELPPAPTLHEPGNGQQFDRESEITLRWKWIRALAPGERFQVSVWPNGQSPSNSIAIALTDQTSWTLSLSQKTPEGRYYWEVVVVYAPDGRTEFASSQTSETGYFADRFPPAPELIQPIDGRKFNREPDIVLDWQWRGLKPDELFMVLVWCDDQSPSNAISSLTSASSWTLNRAQRALICRYNWTVTVVYAPGGQVRAAMSPTSPIGSFEDELASAPTLLKPLNNQKWGGNRKKLTLQWEWAGDLTKDERFQVIVWKPHDPMSESTSYLTSDRSLHIDVSEGSSGDEYNWRVGVVYAPLEVPQIQISQFSEIRRFVLIGHSLFWLVLVGLLLSAAGWWFREPIWSSLVAAYGKLSAWRRERKWVANRQVWLSKFEEFLLQGETVDSRGTYQTVSSALPEIPDHFLRQVIHEYGRQYGQVECIDVQGTPPHLKIRLAGRLEFLATWHQMKRYLDDTIPSPNEEFANLAKRMLQQMCRQLPGVELADFQRSERFIHGFALDGLSTPPLRVPSPFPLIILQKAEITEPDLGNDLYAFAAHSRESHLDTRWAFVIAFDHKCSLGSTKDHLRRLLQRSPLLRGRKYIVLDLKDIFDAVRGGKTDKFIHEVQEQAGLVSISPYHFTGPVRGDEFFGREAEIAAIESVITRHASMAITGAQRIGKTSLLMRVDDELRASKHAVPVFINCESHALYEDFAKVLADKLSEDVEGAAQPIYEASKRLAARYSDRVLVFLLDEADRLLFDERDDRALFHVFRALSQERVCQYVFCGGRELHRSVHTSNHPLARSCGREIILGNLAEADARALITRPLDRMKIDVENGFDPALEIGTMTSCRPIFIQYVCCSLLEHMDERRTRRLDRQTVQTVLSQKRFYEFYVNVAWSSSNPLERLVTLVMSEPGSPCPFSKEDVYSALGNLGFREHDMTDQALDALTGNSFFDVGPRRDNYYFSLTQFPHIVKKVTKIRAAIQDELRHIREGMV